MFAEGVAELLAEPPKSFEIGTYGRLTEEELLAFPVWDDFWFDLPFAAVARKGTFKGRRVLAITHCGRTKGYFEPPEGFYQCHVDMLSDSCTKPGNSFVYIF